VILEDDRKGLPSASKRERWSRCPGSFELEKLIPDTEAGEAAEKGNRIHDALQNGDFSILSVEEADLAQKLSVLEKIAVDQWSDVVGSKEKPTVIREQRLGLKVDSELRLTGKPDAIYSIGKSILVLDYKTGIVPVESAGNAQLRALAVMGCEDLKAEEAYVAIIQAGQGVVLEKLSESAIGMERERLRNELERLSSQKETRAVGPHCQYCKASGVCPEAQNATTALANVSTGTLISPVDLPRLLDSCIVAESVIDAVRQRARDYMSEGGSIQGWKIQTQNRRYITDATEALNRLAEVVGMKKAIEAADISITNAEKLIMDKDACSKRDASQQLGALLADLIDTRPINKLTRSK
jgi:hypothetical protein